MLSLKLTVSLHKSIDSFINFSVMEDNRNGLNVENIIDNKKDLNKELEKPKIYKKPSIKVIKSSEFAIFKENISEKNDLIEINKAEQFSLAKSNIEPYFEIFTNNFELNSVPIINNDNLANINGSNTSNAEDIIESSNLNEPITKINRKVLDVKKDKDKMEKFIPDNDPKINTVKSANNIDLFKHQIIFQPKRKLDEIPFNYKKYLKKESLSPTNENDKILIEDTQNNDNNNNNKKNTNEESDKKSESKELSEENPFKFLKLDKGYKITKLIKQENIPVINNNQDENSFEHIPSKENKIMDEELKDHSVTHKNKTSRKPIMKAFTIEKPIESEIENNKEMPLTLDIIPSKINSNCNNSNESDKEEAEEQEIESSSSKQDNQLKQFSVSEINNQISNIIEDNSKLETEDIKNEESILTQKNLVNCNNDNDNNINEDIDNDTIRHIKPLKSKKIIYKNNPLDNYEDELKQEDKPKLKNIASKTHFDLDHIKSQKRENNRNNAKFINDYESKLNDSINKSIINSFNDERKETLENNINMLKGSFFKETKYSKENSLKNEDSCCNNSLISISYALSNKEVKNDINLKDINDRNSKNNYSIKRYIPGEYSSQVNNSIAYRDFDNDYINKHKKAKLDDSFNDRYYNKVVHTDPGSKKEVAKEEEEKTPKKYVSNIEKHDFNKKADKFETFELNIKEIDDIINNYETKFKDKNIKLDSSTIKTDNNNYNNKPILKNENSFKKANKIYFQTTNPKTNHTNNIDNHTKKLKDNNKKLIEREGLIKHNYNNNNNKNNYNNNRNNNNNNKHNNNAEIENSFSSLNGNISKSLNISKFLNDKSNPNKALAMSEIMRNLLDKQYSPKENNVFKISTNSFNSINSINHSQKSNFNLSKPEKSNLKNLNNSVNQIVHSLNLNSRNSKSNSSLNYSSINNNSNFIKAKDECPNNKLAYNSNNNNNSTDAKLFSNVNERKRKILNRFDSCLNGIDPCYNLDKTNTTIFEVSPIKMKYLNNFY